MPRVKRNDGGSQDSRGRGGHSQEQPSLIPPMDTTTGSREDTPETVADAAEGYEWETFERATLRGSATEPLATIPKGGGVLSLNEQAQRGLGNVRTVELCYDRKRRAIGVRPAPRGTKNSYAVRPKSKGKGIDVAFKAFTTRYGIDTSAATRYRVVFDDGVLVLRPDNLLETIARRQPTRKH